jgi:predicted acylesterase/phospholipase RssA
MTDLAGVDYTNPTRECDIVMKGGITSGVVYPHAICELARTYRFVNVGGTSAGAIAAAATAAAELGRDRGGFAELAELPAWLGGGKHLQELFQPQKSTEGLFRMLLASLEHKRAKWLWILGTGVRRFPLGALLGALPGIALVVLAALSGDGALRWAALAAGVLLALIGAVAGLAFAVVRRATRAIPDNLYGMCSGNAPEGSKKPALTPWLTDLIERCAGRTGEGGAPLTFGDLRRADGPELAMMTTNVTNHTAHRMPWSSQEFWFDPAELRRLFPDGVVDHMIAKPPPLPDTDAQRREAELYRELLQPLRPLPAPDDLPIVVAARMSLSFPILLSAVPLYRIDWSRSENQELDEKLGRYLRGELPGRPDAYPKAEQVWFTDGGASSNFPVHFFDAPLPRRPTFAINLRPFHPDHGEAADEGENVWMVESAGGGYLSWWYPRPAAGGLLDKRLGAFLGDIVDTMQNRVDDAQLRMPGVRDRIVHVSLTEKQGGMNLNMDPKVIKRLTGRGRAAGAKLVRRFGDERAEGEPLSWNDHRWTRLRIAMPAVQQLLADLVEPYEGDPARGIGSYRELLSPGGGEAPYRMSNAAREQARELFDQIAALRAELDSAEEALADGRPSPAPTARMVPPE